MIGDLSISLPLWGVVAVVALPLFDLLHSFTPWSRHLWQDHDHTAWATYWSINVGIRWLQTGIVVAVLVAAEASFSAVGVRLPSMPVTGGSLLVVLVGVTWYGYVAASAPTVPRPQAPTEYTTQYPADAEERGLFLAVSFTAGICEEFVFRGVVFAALVGLGAWWPIAAIVAAVAFAFSHGLAVLNPIASGLYVTMALAMTAIVIVTGSLLPAVAIHVAWNLASVANDLQDAAPESTAA
jgi:membrane protease YdiL (CAAX protease family)